LIATCLAAAIFGSAAAEDRRSEAIDAYLLIDRSAAMSQSGEAAEWICSAIVDGLLQAGDRVTLWAFSDRTERIAETTLSDDRSKEELKSAIRSVTVDGAEADFSMALRAVAAAEATRSDRGPLAYVLIASPLTHRPNGNGRADAEAASLLRFSRVVDHPGWKAVTLGLGIEHQAKAAAAAFIEALRSTKPAQGTATTSGEES
jgi:hypothetical protein